MSKKTQITVQIEGLEEKALLSPIPVLSRSTLSHAYTAIDRAAGTFARTHNEHRVQNDLTRIARTIPFGRQNLLPTWQADTAIYDPNTRGSGLEAVRQIKLDLTNYVRQSVADGTFRLR